MTLTLTDAEKAMLNGSDGNARQKAMQLLVRNAEALGAERFVETTNVAGVPGSTTRFLQRHYQHSGGTYNLCCDLLALRSGQWSSMR